MGSGQSVSITQAKPEQFVTQAHLDWKHQMETLFKSRSTITKTVILPPGVQLNDRRLAEGVVVSERKYTIPSGVLPEWPDDTPFECDIDGRLLPPCFGKKETHAHYAIYPDKYFPELNCGFCQLHQQEHPDFIPSMASASIHGGEAKGRKGTVDTSGTTRDTAQAQEAISNLGEMTECTEPAEE